MEDPLSKSSFLSKNKVNYKVITIIVGIAIIFQIFNVYIIPQELDELDPIEILLTTSYVISAIVAFSLAKKYTGSKIFAVAYFFFGMGELMIVLGEIVWNYLEISGMTTYPSIADVFYFGVYPFLILHLVLNIQDLNPESMLLGYDFFMAIKNKRKDIALDILQKLENVQTIWK